jgi:transglutaminase-like putative cysteine protease
LRASTADPAAALRLRFEALPNRPVSDPGPVARRPALSQTLFHVTETQRRALEAPGQSTPATEADFRDTEDARITPEIRALAAELGHDVTAIYQYVRNQIAFEPYYGSRKGALLTLWERSGNDIDTASLLIALLRASDHPARYVRGTIAIDAGQAQNWVGNAPDLDTAARIFAKGGVPVSVSEDERLVKEHVWVEVQVRGAGAAAREWVALDASFKQFDYRTPMDFTEITGFNTARWVEDARPLMSANNRLQAVSSLPEMISPDLPDESTRDRNFVDVRVENAITKTRNYIEAHPERKTRWCSTMRLSHAMRASSPPESTANSDLA